MGAIAEVEPQELKRRLDAGDCPLILDVREPWEIAIASLPGTLNIPLQEVPARLGEIDRGAELIVVICHGGGRSRRAAEFLAARGFTRIANLSGGIDAWSREVDPSLPTY